MNPKTISEANIRLKKLVNLSFKAIGLKKPPEIKSENDADWGATDVHEAGVSIDGSIFIVPFELCEKEYKVRVSDALKTSGCPAKRLTREINRAWKSNNKDLIRYEVSVLVHDPGVRYYPDGSGQPPSDDIEPIKGFEACPSMDAAVEKAIELYIKNIVDITMENLYYTETAKEEKEIEKEMRRLKI